MSKEMLEDKIYDFLKCCDKGSKRKAVEIAKAVGLTTAKDVNSTLYRMQKAGLLQKTDSTPPLWSVKSSDAQNPDSRGCDPTSACPQLKSQNVPKAKTGDTSSASRETQDCSRESPNNADVTNSSPELLRGLEEFSVVEEIDEGGFGCIYKVKHKVDKQWYAVKIVRYKRKMDKREVAVLAKFNHPNIVRYFNSWIGPPYQYSHNNNGPLSTESALIVEVKKRSFPTSSVDLQPTENSDSTQSEDEDSESYSQSSSSDMSTKKRIATADRCLYILMEFCEGGALKDWLKNKGKDRTKEEALGIFRQIVEGVEYIHSQGCIHRDLKPDNILFADKNQIKIGDFGLVTLTCDKNGGQIERTKKRGTPSYMSPEQGNQRYYDKKTDIFPLGLIFFELLWKLNTDTERFKLWNDLRSCKFPAEFCENYASEHRLILKMLSDAPAKRPDACYIKEFITTFKTKLRTV